MTEVGPTVAGGPDGGRVRCGSVIGLRIPADAGSSVPLTASALSDAIGGGLLEDALIGEVDGGGYTFYLDEHRVAKGLPPNGRAAVLAARLGQVNRAWLSVISSFADDHGVDLRGHVVDVSLT